MASSSDIRWFKTTFGPRITQAVRGTVFDVDMLTALACQETGELWTTMRRVPTLTPDQIAALCCGDTLDEDAGRRAFPRTMERLVAAPRGQEMFDIARAALLAMADHVPAYRFARNKPKEFCHGFGVFQRDLQFFRDDPDYFLEKRYEVFEHSLGHALGELARGLRTLRLQDRTSISDLEFCHVAICYNTGGFDPARGLKQGHSVGGKFYGEFIRDLLAQARTVGTDADTPVTPPPADPPPGGGSITATGPTFRVETSGSTLRLRSAPRISVPPTANVVADMPRGHLVRAVTGAPVDGFIEVETILGGRLFRGFASADHLVRVP